MTIKSISGAMAVAVAVLGMSSPAMADYTCDEKADLADAIECHAEALTCTYFKNDVPVEDSKHADRLSWTNVDDAEYDYPIWQWKGKGGFNGCEVHAKLAKQLFVPHDSPPIGSGKSKAVAKGAANDLRDDKIDSAVQHLCNFRNTIEFSARLNQDAGIDHAVVYGLSMDQIAFAEAAIMQLNYDPAQACAE